MNIQQINNACLALILGTVLAACGSDSGGDNNSNNNDQSGDQSNDATSTNGKVAKNFVDNLASPAFQQFATDSGKLPTIIKNYCNSINNGTGDGARMSAQQAWLGLENQWQATKLYHTGVLSEEYGKRAKAIYTRNNLDFSTVIAINNQVSTYKQNSNLKITDSTSYSVRGLDVLEYLLYDDRANNQDSCNYAVLVSQNLADNATELKNSWLASRNDLLTNSQSNAVDLVQPFFDNIVNLIDKDIKDAGLGTPMGLKAAGSCTGVCPEKVEHNISHTSYDSIKASLENLKATYTGNGGAGFKLYYDNNNMTTEAEQFAKKIDAAISTVSSQKTSLYEQLEQIKSSGKKEECRNVATTGNSNAQVFAPCKVYYQIKQLSDEIKTGSFKVAVNLDLPAAAAGDGD